MRCVLVALVTIALSVPGLGAQATPGSVPKPAPFFYWGVDVGVTTLSALVQGRASRVPLRRALMASLVGGSVMYAGQRIVGSTEPALRLAGIQTVALGANLGRNIGKGVPALSDLVLPLYPFYVRVRRDERPVVSVRLSTMAVAGAIRMASTYHRPPDLLRSLASGALVFPIPRDDLHCYERWGGECVARRLGEHFAGAVAFAEHPEPCTTRLLVAHEMGHVAQDVRDAVLNGVPMSDFVLRARSWREWIGRIFVIDAFLPLMAASRVAGPPGFDAACGDLDRFYECEADAMLWRRGCEGDGDE